MDQLTQTTTFCGAKAAFLMDSWVIALLRDDKPGLPFANMWDLPGGGREGLETPEETVLRETYEEIGLHLPPDRLTYKTVYANDRPGRAPSWFFGGWVTEAETARMVLGDEGQELRLMPIADFLTHPSAIPSLQMRLKLYLAQRDG